LDCGNATVMLVVRQLPERLHRSAINQKLCSRDNHVVAGLQPASHRIVVAECVAEGHRSLSRKSALVGLLRDIDKRLSADARNTEYRNCGRRGIAPNNARFDQLLTAEPI